MANSTSSQLQQLYIAYFSRPGDPIGLDYWTGAGITTKAFAANMYLQPEFQDVYGELSVKDQINQLYINLFSRDGDDSGLNYWAGKIDSGEMELASIANDLIYAATYGDAEGSEDDLACLTNKTSAAVAFTEQAKSLAPAICLYSEPMICTKSTYEPESTDPWKDGKIFENVKEWMGSICKTVITFIPAEELLEGGYTSSYPDFYPDFPAAAAAAAAEAAAANAFVATITGTSGTDKLESTSSNDSINLHSSLLKKDSLTGLTSQGNLLVNEQESEELINTESNEISNLECGCNKELETLAIEDGLYSSFGNPYVDNSLKDHSPYGLGTSNNIVIESLVSVENVLF